MFRFMETGTPVRQPTSRVAITAPVPDLAGPSETDRALHERGSRSLPLGAGAVSSFAFCLGVKQQGVEFFFAQQPANFSKCKQRDKCTEYDQAARKQLVNLYVGKGIREACAMHQPFNHFFENVKAEN